MILEVAILNVKCGQEKQFEIDFALMTGELALMLADLVKALGGEKEKT